MPGRLLMRTRIGGQARRAEGLRGRVSRGDGRFGAECVLRSAAAVDFASSACFWKSVGQNASECMLPWAARGLPFRTFRVKCLVDGVRFSGLPGRRTPRGAGSPPGARTRWRNDQQFFGNHVLAPEMTIGVCRDSRQPRPSHAFVPEMTARHDNLAARPPRAQPSCHHARPSPATRGAAQFRPQEEAASKQLQSEKVGVRAGSHCS